MHYFVSVARILSDYYEELSQLGGFNQEQVDSYIEDALTGENTSYIAKMETENFAASASSIVNAGTAPARESK